LGRQRVQELTDEVELKKKLGVDAGLNCSQYAVLAVVLATAKHENRNATRMGRRTR
jgi:hypothetical protein